jgi:hypothetical protein
MHTTYGMSKTPGKKLRNQAATEWGEVKSSRVSTRVTPTGYGLFVDKLKSVGLSIAEFVEQVARGKIQLLVVHESLAELLSDRSWEDLVEIADIPI